MKNTKYFLLLFISIVTFSCSEEASIEQALPQGRFEYELARLADPTTGEIPLGIRMKEIAYASTLPKSKSLKNSSEEVFKSIGPYNIGGRTRAMAIDLQDTATILAGGVSGGMWKTTNSGKTWYRTSAMDDMVSTYCIKQDPRNGKSNIWYYGTGERRANSASAHGSAHYSGNGIYKSTNNGESWVHLSASFSKPNHIDDWTYVHNIAVDPIRNDSDIVLIATRTGILRSNDGGESWQNVLSGNSNSDWSNVIVSSTGIFYAHLSSNSGSGGIYRSTDGINWILISQGNFPNTHQRALLELAPSNENVLFIFATTPGSGQQVNPDDLSSDNLSLFKYTYLSGDGSDTLGNWENRSFQIPASTRNSERLTTFNNYCMQLKVKSDDENMVFLGGTNIFRSSDAFASSQNTAIIGGYAAQGYTEYQYHIDGQHPDQHEICFYPGNPNIMLASSDGGVHRTDNCTAFKVLWNDLNNGYVTTQFYAIATSHDIELPLAVGGMQDNGTWFTNQDDATSDWIRMRGGDGAFAALTHDATVGYFSSQRGNIRRYVMNPTTGETFSSIHINPDFEASYRFIHPFTIDPLNDDRMYLPVENRVYRNDNLAHSNVRDNWVEILDLGSNRATVTAVSPSFQNDGVVYAGTSNQHIYRIENANTSNPTYTRIDQGIVSGGYTANIAVDPRNSDKILVVFSNYNVRSLWYSENAGTTWIDVEGNLVGEPDNPSAPEEFWYIGSGPSLRWARIVPSVNGSSMYVLGTSVGLFTTSSLDSNQTKWVQQSASQIGNAVIDMVDVRLSDGYTVIGTHGNGVFSGYLLDENFTSVTDYSNKINEMNIQIYPNPASSATTVRMKLENPEQIQIALINQLGQTVEIIRKEVSSGTQEIYMPFGQVGSGLFYLQIKGKDFETTKKIIIN